MNNLILVLMVDYEVLCTVPCCGITAGNTQHSTPPRANFQASFLDKGRLQTPSDASMEI